MKNQSTEVCQRWKQSCRTLRIIEVAGLILIAVILILGMIFDLRKTHFLFIDEFSNVSLAALQIQASTSAISIALVALISGAVSEEYHGISVSNYFLNIKPLIFKQNIIIISSIALIGINMLMHLIGAYNLVLAILWVSCVLIIISVIELYSAFRGRNNTASEIAMYLDYMLLNPKIPLKKKCNLFSDYVSCWPSTDQNKVEYENEKERYLRTVSALLEEAPEAALGLLEDVSSTLVKGMLAVSDTGKIYRGIEIFEETYIQIWAYVSKQGKHVKHNFDLYSECDRELFRAMNMISAEDLEQTVHWRRMTDVICKVVIYCHSEAETDAESLCKHMRHIRWIPSAVGGALSERKERGEKIRSDRWKYTRFSILWSDVNIPSDVKTEYNAGTRQMEFAFYCALIRNCQGDIAGTIFTYLSLDYPDDKYNKITLALLVICYTYYIAEYESLDCVAEEEKNTAREMLQIQRQNGIFLDIIYRFSLENITQDYSQLFKEIVSTLNEYERLPRDGSIKTCIADARAKDFILLVTALSSAYRLYDTLLESVITNENAATWYSSHFGNSYAQTQERLGRMVRSLCSESNDVEGLLESGLGEINKVILSKYKAQSLLDAKNKYAEFETLNQEGALIHRIEKTLESRLRTKCKEMFLKPKGKLVEKEFHLPEHPIPVDIFIRGDVGQIVPYLETNFVHMLARWLYANKRMDIFTRETADEERYFKLVAEKPFILVGPDSAFRPYDYRRCEEFDQLISNCTRVNLGRGSIGMLLNQPGIAAEIVKFEISMHHLTIDSCECAFDQNTGLYSYSMSSGVSMQYTKDELEDYLFNGTMVFDFTVKLNIEDTKGKCGYIIQREKCKDK